MPFTIVGSGNLVQTWPFPNGSQATPSMSFQGAPNSGFFHSGAGNVGLAVNGIQQLQVHSNGISSMANIEGTYIKGNGSLLTGIVTTFSNASSLTEGTLQSNLLPLTLGNVNTTYLGNGYLLSNLNAASLVGNIDSVDLSFSTGSVPTTALYGTLDGDVVITGDIDASTLTGNLDLSLNFSPGTVPATALYGTLSNTVLPTINLANTSGVLSVTKGGSGVVTSTGTGNVVLSDNPTLYGNVTVLGNVSAKGVILNIFQQEDNSPYTISTSINPSNQWTIGPTFTALPIKAKSKLRISVFVPWRNQNTTAYGGLYVDPQFQVNVNVGTYTAGTWVSIGHSGYQMISGATDEMMQFVNEFYLPFSIPVDCTIQFRYRFTTYDAPAMVNQNNVQAGDALLTQFGLSQYMPYTKIIITEIGG